MVHIDVTRMWCRHHKNVLRPPDRLYGSQPTSPLRKMGAMVVIVQAAVAYSNQRAQQKFKRKKQLGITVE